MALTLFEKIWKANTVVEETVATPAILYVGLHLMHDITAPQAFHFLQQQGLKVRRPDLCLATADHCAPTRKTESGDYRYKDDNARDQIQALEKSCAEHGIRCFGLDHENQGIVHVIGPELGLSQPGKVIVCGDSHTSTHGAFGAIAFGIGSSEVAQVMASQCILQRKPKNFRIQIDGELSPDVTAKDLAIYIISKIGAKGGQGFAIEYQGSTIRALSMEERMTICNMTIEAGARFGLIAPDEVTADYLRNTPEAEWINFDSWKELHSDRDALWQKSISLRAEDVRPMMTWGTTPDMAVPIGGRIPTTMSPEQSEALAYMDWKKGESLQGRPVDLVFIGSCTNGRISDLRKAAQAVKGRKIAKNLECLVVPGSRQIKDQAEKEGLAQIFEDAGMRWGEPSCSLCNAMNGDIVAPKALAVSTSNRNFQGRQGPGSRTILVSPETAVAVAMEGALL